MQQDIKICQFSMMFKFGIWILGFQNNYLLIYILKYIYIYIHEILIFTKGKANSAWLKSKSSEYEFSLINKWEIRDNNNDIIRKDITNKQSSSLFGGSIKKWSFQNIKTYII